MLYFIIPTSLLFLLIKRKSNTFSSDAFASLCIAVCLSVGILLLTTEVLSFFKAVTFFSLLFTWIGIDLTIGILISREYSKRPLVINKPARIPIAYILITTILVVVLVLDYLTVPYNWDSLTYHLPRIMMWAQNHSVNHFATYDVRQVSSPYLSEYIILHQFMLLRTDRFFNFVQGLSFCFCAFGIHSICKKIGLPRKWQILATLLFISMPISFAEALTTQVDLLTTVWFIIFAYFWLDLVECKELKLHKNEISRVLIMAMSVGFAYISKPSVCIGMVIFLFVLLIKRLLNKDKFIVLLGLIAIAGLVVALIICPGIIRNIYTFNTISPKEVGAKQLVGTGNPKYLFINFIKNICYTLPVPYIRNSESFFYKLPGKIADLIHVDLNDASISENGQPYMYSNVHDYRHDTAINPLIVWLFLCSLIINLIAFIKEKRFSPLKVSIAFSFFSFMTIVRWEPFETRYELSYLAMLCPYIVLSLFQFSKKKKNTDTAIISMISLLCIFTSYNLIIFHINIWRNYANIRPKGYFAYNDIYNSWKNVTDIVNDNGYHSLGLHSTSSYFTYPVWVLCEDVERIELITVKENNTQIYIDVNYHPEAIIWFGDLDTFENEYTWNCQQYHVVYSDDICCLLTSDS